MFCCKYSDKRARNIKLALIFFTASAEDIRVYLKYTFFYNIHLGLQVLRLSLESASFEFER